MKKLFIDSDTILDFFLERADYKYSAALFQYINQKKFSALSSSIVFANVYYIHKKAFNHEKCIQNLSELRKIISIIITSEKSLDMALKSNFKDFEDALQYFSALESKANFIITRNSRDYLSSRIPAMSAKEFLYSENL